MSWIQNKTSSGAVPPNKPTEILKCMKAFNDMHTISMHFNTNQSVIVQISDNSNNNNTSTTCRPPQMMYSVSQKNPPPPFFWHFPQNCWEFLVQILPAYCTFPPTLDYKILLKYLQLWQSYATLSVTTIICSKCPQSVETHTGWSHLIWHNFVIVGDSLIKTGSQSIDWNV